MMSRRPSPNHSHERTQKRAKTMAQFRAKGADAHKKLVSDSASSKVSVNASFSGSVGFAWIQQIVDHSTIDASSVMFQSN